MSSGSRFGDWATAGVLALMAFAAAGVMNSAGEQSEPRHATATPAPMTCGSCHTDYDGLLAEDHPKISGDTVGACLDCHPTDRASRSARNLLSARLHPAHLPPKGDLDCEHCHTWRAAEHFGLAGVTDDNRGAPTAEDMQWMRAGMLTWVGSGFLDHLHARAGIGCADCHGRRLPPAETTLTNEQCLACHGPLEKLVERSTPSDFADRNPHQSHLGEIACTVCHKAHMASSVYCLGCHRNFEMTIPGGQ
ncbi:cytochrome c3 family protein [Desulfatitalea alkaliphila]|uniref:Cytochrome c3 family protein n=1 Tax=Desulfatitalea alkaliphila TaxID=2929485 RepID=A0AA41R1C9_9BACT|nr:cytochrome c3 family protein [Desulfatitalea alkaliphila]MCJ8499881.1 cytochrome c3 family protein [Desulfatitalea alkaliphila]